MTLTFADPRKHPPVVAVNAVRRQSQMTPAPIARRTFLRTVAFASGALAAAPLWADETADGLREPVHRVAKVESATPAKGAVNGPEHPLDPALQTAQEALARIRETVTDYTAVMIKRERIKGVLGDFEYMSAKIRNRKVEGDQVKVPLSVYLKFLKPDNIKGREVLWVEGKNNNKLRAHEGGIIPIPAVWLDPNGVLAMRGNLHPINDIGIENLVIKLIEKGQTVRKLGPENCKVWTTEGAKVNDRVCTVINVNHPEQRPPYEFCLAQIFIDDELQVPIRYVAYSWPTAADDKTGPVLEEYTYLKLKLNVGLQDIEFDVNNPNYNL
jgi:Protein of unknown function (DUF1571).